MKPEDVSPVASAALTRAFEDGRVEFRKCSHFEDDVAHIVFRSEDVFQAWFLAEMAEKEQQVRERVAAEEERAEQAVAAARKLAKRWEGPDFQAAYARALNTVLDNPAAYLALPDDEESR